MTKYLYIGIGVLILALGIAVDRWIDARADAQIATAAANQNKKMLDEYQQSAAVVAQISILAQKKAASDAAEIAELRARLKNVPTCPLDPADRDAIFGGVQ